MKNTNTKNNIIFIEIRGKSVSKEQAAEIKTYFKNNFNYMFSQIDWIKDNGVIRGCGQLDSQKVQDSLEETLKEVAKKFEYLEFGLLFTDEPLESYIDLFKAAPFTDKYRVREDDYTINKDDTVKLNEYGKRKVLINLVYGEFCDRIKGALVAEGQYFLNKLMPFIHYDNQTLYDVNIYNDNLCVAWNDFDVKFNDWIKKTGDLGRIINIRGRHVAEQKKIKEVREISLTDNEGLMRQYRFINDEGDIYLNRKFYKLYEYGPMVLYFDIQKMAKKLKALEMLVIFSKSQEDILGTANLVVWICRGEWKVIRDKKLIEKIFNIYEESCRTLEIRVILDMEAEVSKPNNYHMGRLDDYDLYYIELQKEIYMDKFLDVYKNII